MTFGNRRPGRRGSIGSPVAWRAGALASAVLVLGRVAGADPFETELPAPDAEQSSDTATETAPTPVLPVDLESNEAPDAPVIGQTRPVESIGSLSVGHPHDGYLFNGVQMPRGPQWTVTDPASAWGTEETVRDLKECIAAVHRQFPGSPPVMIGSISRPGGGPFPPHKSHRSGRDVDVYFYYKPGTTKYYEPAGEHNLDKARTWGLLRAVITLTDVDFVLIDQKVQRLLEQHALSVGEDPSWIADLFHGSGRYPVALIKHVPGHVAHMHIRFTSPKARRRGLLAYDALVELGHIQPPTRAMEHAVVRGDTLIGIGKKYRVPVSRIVELNHLESTTIRVGQRLVIQAREDIRGARDPVVVPRRRRPNAGPSERDVATRAALLEIERQLKEELSL